MTTHNATESRAYSGSHLTRLVVASGVVPVVSALVASGLMLSWAPELPDPIAIHWGANGQVDGFGSLAGMIVLVLGLVVVFSAAVTVSLSRMRAIEPSAPRSQPRFLGATSAWLGVFLSIGMGGSVAVQRGVADAADVGSITPVMIAGVILGLAAAVAAWFVIPAPAVDGQHDDSGADVMALSADERVSWSSAVRPPARLVALFAGIFVVSIALSAAGAVSAGGWTLWFVVALLLVVLVLSVVTFYWRVTVTSSGFSARTAGGVLGITIPLREIAAARVVQVSPLADFGGWGWRIVSGRTGIVVRAGEAIQVERNSGRSVVVTVDDAATAASLIEGLVERRGTA